MAHPTTLPPHSSPHLFSPSSNSKADIWSGTKKSYSNCKRLHKAAEVLGTSADHDLFQPYFPLILRRDKQITEGHQLFLLYRFPDSTTVWARHGSFSQMPHSNPRCLPHSPATCHTGLLHEPTQERYNKPCESPCPMPDSQWWSMFTTC